jgi:PD-(D/E)XK endonuclease
MTEEPLDKPTWTDSKLASAVAASRSWRGVMRELGLSVTSAGAIRIIKRHVIRLGLDTSHFTGQRRWSDMQLKLAAANAQSWWELFSQLGRSSYNKDDRIRVKAHAVRLGLDLSRLDGLGADAAASPEIRPDVKHLRAAGTAIAAMWFLLCGCNASIPVEPAVYDLLVSMSGRIMQVQVKTTTYNSKNGWMVQVGRRPYSVGNREPLVPYDPDLIDLFFILDGDLTMYLIPSRVLAGRVMVLLRNYSKYIVGDIGSLKKFSTPAA